MLQKFASDSVDLHKLSSDGMAMDDPILVKSHMEQNADLALWNIDDSMKDAIVMCMVILFMTMFPNFAH